MLNHFNGDGNVTLHYNNWLNARAREDMCTNDLNVQKSRVPEDEPVALHCGAGLPVFSSFPVLSCDFYVLVFYLSSRADITLSFR